MRIPYVACLAWKEAQALRALLGAAASQEQLWQAGTEHVAYRGSGRGEDLDTLKAKREGLLPTWRGSEGKAGFSQGTSLFKLLAFLGLHISNTALLSG